MPSRIRPDRRELAAELVHSARRLLGLADDIVTGRASARFYGLPGLEVMNAAIEHFLEPVRKISRLVDRILTPAPGITDELEAEIAQARALLAEIESRLEPKKRGPKPRWQDRFPRWRREIEASKKRGELARILRREVPEREHETVRRTFNRWNREK
jgi:hypothetical protein